MAKPKIVFSKEPETLAVTEEVVVPSSIAKLSVDYGREDLNNMAKKINEIIDLYEHRTNSFQSHERQ